MRYFPATGTRVELGAGYDTPSGVSIQDGVAYVSTGSFTGQPPGTVQVNEGTVVAFELE